MFPPVAQRSQTFWKIAVYEPGVSIAGSMPLDWLTQSRRLLSAAARAPAFTVGKMDALHRIFPVSAMEIVGGLDHTAPQKAPRAVGERVLRFL